MDVLGFEDRNISAGLPGLKASFLGCGLQSVDLFGVCGQTTSRGG